MKLCGVCHNPTESPMGTILHMPHEGGIVCGNTGKRTFAYEGEAPPKVLTADERVLQAQTAVLALAEALSYHEDHEGAPVEVRSDEGWTEVMELLKPVMKALGLPE